MYEEAVSSGKIAAPHRGPLPSGCKYQRVRNTSCDATEMMDKEKGKCEKDVQCCFHDCDSARFTARKAFGDFVDGVFVVEDLKEGEMPMLDG